MAFLGYFMCTDGDGRVVSGPATIPDKYAKKSNSITTTSLIVLNKSKYKMDVRPGDRKTLHPKPKGAGAWTYTSKKVPTKWTCTVHRKGVSQTYELHIEECSGVILINATSDEVSWWDYETDRTGNGVVLSSSESSDFVSSKAGTKTTSASDSD